VARPEKVKKLVVESVSGKMWFNILILLSTILLFSLIVIGHQSEDWFSAALQSILFSANLLLPT
jgi:hypothetical protein